MNGRMIAFSMNSDGSVARSSRNEHRRIEKSLSGAAQTLVSLRPTEHHAEPEIPASADRIGPEAKFVDRIPLTSAQKVRNLAPFGVDQANLRP
jgi:hypothetical protein